jgi:Ca-activated chloride channel family protein
MTWTLSGLPPLVVDTPWLLLAMGLLPLFVWWLRTVQARERERRLTRFAEPSSWQRLVASDAGGERSRTWRLVLAVTLAGGALAGPRWGLAHGAATGRGIDMAIALDASLSMLATDDRPSRLERMKQEVRRLRSLARADRVALIAFAGRSYILTPLTADDGALELFLDNLDPSVVGQGGSALSRAVRQGAELLLASDGQADRALVVMSDGESFDAIDELRAAATDAGKKGISLVTVGFGTREGSTIPVREDGVLRQKRDDDGRVVVTRYVPELLDAAAQAAGGTFIPAEADDKAARIRRALRQLRTARRQLDVREDHVPRFLWLLLPALLLLCWDSWRLIPVRRGPSARRAVATRAVETQLLLLVAVPWIVGACTEAPDPAVLFAEGNVPGAVAAYRAMQGAGDTTQRTAYNLGTALLATDSIRDASERLEAVRRATDGELRFRARFNAGVAALRQGLQPENPRAAEQLAAARSAFRAVLQDRPGYADAQWNYELALRRSPPSPNTSSPSGGTAQPQPEQRDVTGPLDPKQANALLNSAAREEREVQGRRQRQARPPVGGKDW